MGGNAECQINKWPEGECCCNCKQRIELEDGTPPYKKHGYVCVALYESGYEIINPTEEHGKCEFWMEKK